jgi:tetratricopeptide (TPR) repeat protein
MKQEMNYSMYVDRYLDGVMSVDEKFWFEKELQHDAKLQEEVRLQENLQKMLAEKEIIELESELDAIYAKTYQPLRKRISSLPKEFIKYMVVAASIVMIIITTITLIGRHSVPGDEIYNEHFQPADFSMSFRAGGSELSNDLRTAMTLYEKHEYADAIQLFEKVLSEDNSRIGLNLYSGISHMEIEEYDEANRSFQKVIDNKANAFVESAQWYLGLCYLKTEETEKAAEIFGNIARQDGYYKRDARKIMKKLR